MSIRKITSLTMLLIFIPLVLTSIVLYIAPEGRVAFWSGWHILGLGKRQWGNIHINLGFLFLVAGLLHLFLNWKPILAYLKNKAKQFTVFTPEFIISLLLTLAVIIGTLIMIPPFSCVLDLSGSFKRAAAQKYGRPPYAHAEMSSLKILSKRTGLDLEQMLENLTQANITYQDENQTLLAVSRQNATTPRVIFEAMQPEGMQQDHGKAATLSNKSFSGLGKTSLANLCTGEGLEVNRVISSLAEKNITASPNQTIKEIAEANSIKPRRLYEMIHSK